MTAKVDGDRVLVSVIVPVRDADGVLGEQLAALSRQQDAPPFEVVVVDDHSLDASAEVARSFRGRIDHLVIVPSLERRNVAHARNVGVAAACGELLLFCDADDVVADGWVRAMTRLLAEHELVAGRSEISRLNAAWTHATRAVPQQHGLQDFGLPGWDLVHGGGGNVGMRRSVYERVGPFDESPALAYAEAADYFFRAQLAGITPWFSHDATVHVRFRDSYRGAYRQARGWAESSVALHRKFEPLGMPRPGWVRGVLAWVLVPLRLLRVRDRGDLSRWFHLLGWRVGRLRGSIRSRLPAL